MTEASQFLAESIASRACPTNRRRVMPVENVIVSGKPTKEAEDKIAQQLQQRLETHFKGYGPVLKRDRRQVQVAPTVLGEQMLRQVIWMQALHDQNYLTGSLVVQS